MRTIRYIAVSFIFAAIFAVSAFAQAVPAQKIALVDTDAFYSDQGITKIITAYKGLQTEFAPTQKELETLGTKLQTLQKEIQTMRDQLSSGGSNQVPIKQETVQAKLDEYERTETEFKRKQEDAKARYGKREAAVIGPIVQDVGKQIGEFAKQKGYTLILDSGKLYQAQILLYLQDTTDITKEFITFYNARPAGTATTAKPE